MTEFSDRLQAVQERGNLNLSDLHRWFGRPYHTVRAWAFGYTEPAGWANYTQVFKRLEALEQAVKDRSQFPIPDLSPHEHAAYFRRIVDEQRNGGVSRKHSSG